MAIGDVFRLSLLYSNPNSGCVAANVWAYRQEDVLVFDTPGEDLVQAFKQVVEAEIQAVLSSDWQLNQYRVRGLTDPTYGFDFNQTGVNGAQSGEPMAPQCAQLVSWKTGLVGRRFNGRTFFPSTSEANQTRGNLAPAQISALQTLADDMVLIGNGVNTTFWQLGIWSSVEGFTPVTNGVVRPSERTQRHRASTTG